MRASQRPISINKVNLMKIQINNGVQLVSTAFRLPLGYFCFFLDAYIIKLFDRSVDLAQFNTSTPLYPICRAWMRNNPSVREPLASPSSPHSMSEEEVNNKINNI